jgi:hypothetical protein
VKHLNIGSTETGVSSNSENAFDHSGCESCIEYLLSRPKGLVINPFVAGVTSFAHDQDLTILFLTITK